MQRLISKKERINEGSFYFDELIAHLNEWKSPLCINLHLDDTRIIHKIEYDSLTDRYVGFVLPLKDGLPICDAYIYGTYKEISEAYKNCPIAKYAHVIVAKPITVDTPSFVLSVLGTDSKYNSDVISRRWAFIRNELAKRKVKVISYGADGAGPFLKAMVEESRIFNVSESSNIPTAWREFFLMPQISKGDFHSQDTVHLLAKLRTRLLTPSNLTVIGTETAGVAHLKYLVDQLPKERHGLSHQMINNKDKQNYQSIATLVGEDVESCLSEVSVKIRATGTITYLKIMRNIRDSTFDKTLSPIERIFLMWEVIFFLRIWKAWLKHNGYSETENFITSNAYVCTELNAHMLIGIIYNIIKGYLPKECMRIWTTGSQGCEQIFRLLRSMTPVFSTIINFSLKGILERIHKLSYLSHIESCEDIIFPRVKRRLLQLNKEKEETFLIPSIDEITTSILKAKESAISLSTECGMTLDSYDDATNTKDVAIIDDAIANDFEGEETALHTQEHPDDSVSESDVITIKEDLAIIKLKKSSSSGIPTYLPSTEKGTVAEKSFVNSKRSKVPFIEYNGAFIRKTTALYIIQENTQISNDRLLRVRSDQPSHLFSGTEVNDRNLSPKNLVHAGDLCLFRRIDCEKVLLGRIVQFSYLFGSKRERQYSGTYVDMDVDSFKNIGVFCHYFARCKGANQKSVPFVPLENIFKAGYLGMEHYICTIEESEITMSEDDSVPFEINVSALKKGLPKWKSLLSSDLEFK